VGGRADRGRKGGLRQTEGLGGRGRGEVDEIEMELPEGTDGPAGFRTRRKIKTRPNGCEGKFYPALAAVELCPDRTVNYRISERFSHEIRMRF